MVTSASRTRQASASDIGTSAVLPHQGPNGAAMILQSEGQAQDVSGQHFQHRCTLAAVSSPGYAADGRRYRRTVIDLARWRVRAMS